MVAKLHDISEKTMRDNLVCPIITECKSFRLYNRPDINSLLYIIQFCGSQYMQCQVYKSRHSLQDGSSDPVSPSSRASPTTDAT